MDFGLFFRDIWCRFLGIFFFVDFGFFLGIFGVDFWGIFGWILEFF